MRKRRSIITTILALLVLLTALPAFSLKAQAAELYTVWKRADKPVQPTRYEMGIDPSNTSVVYCLNRERPEPTLAGIDGYQVSTNTNIDSLVGNKNPIHLKGSDLEHKLIDIFIAGYGNGENKYGITPEQFQAVTQYAVWYYTDDYSPIEDDMCFLGKVGADVSDEKIIAIADHWDDLSKVDFLNKENPTEEEKAEISKYEAYIRDAKKMLDALESIKKAPAQDEGFYKHNHLEIYYTKRTAKDAGSEDESRKSHSYQNFAGIKTIVEDPSKEFLFSKDDANGSKEIEGAKLIVEGLGEGGTDKKGAVVKEEWKSEAGKSHKIKLYEGEYKMTEVTAPDGYEVAESIIFRVVKDDNGDLKVEIKDGDNKWEDPQSDIADNVRMKDKRWTTPVNFSKTAVNGTEELPGATLKVVRGEGTNGELVSEWVSTTEQKKINLEMDTYTMIEITAPKGYEKAESIIFRVTKDKKIEIKQPDGSWATLDQSVVHMEDAETPEEPKKEDPKPEEPKKEDPKPEEPKKEDPKPEEPKKEDPKPQQPEQPSNPAPEQPAVDTPDPVQPAPTPAPAQDNVAVLGAIRTEDNVEQVADPGQAAVLGSRRSPETADPAPLTTLVVLAGSSLVGILTLLVVWHDANHAPRKKRR